MQRLMKALVSNGIFSVISLALSVIVARSGGADDLGMFGVAFAAYLLVQLIVRDAGANTIVAVLPSRRKIRRTAQRISFLGLVFGLPVAILGLLLGSPYLLVIGLTTHGTCLYDYSKALSLGLDDGKTALVQDVLLFIVFSLAAPFAFFGIIDPLALVVVWGFTNAILGYVVSFLQRYHLAPMWKGDSVELRTSFVFGSQALIGSGSVHVLTFLLSVVGGPVLIGAMRGASTILGPSNLITSTIQPLLITYLVRSSPRSGTVSMPAVRKTAMGLVSVHLAITAGLVSIGASFGDRIMGPTWQHSAPLVLVVALDSVLVAVGAVPLAAHRSLWKSRRLARINTWIVFARIPLVLVGAFGWGALGAVVGFLVVTAASSLAWWTSLIQLHRSTSSRQQDIVRPESDFGETNAASVND